MMFTAMLLAVENPKPLKAYFLQGHGEPSLSDSGDPVTPNSARRWRENYIPTEPLQLLGDT